MKNTYILRINCKESEINSIDEIIGVSSTDSSNLHWEMCLVEEELDPVVDFVDRFLNLLDEKYNALSKIGVSREDITIWRYYEYDRECNLEIAPDKMKRLGEQGISLCISCWQQG